MATRKERNKHLTDDQRLALEAALRERKSLSQIMRETGIPRSTAKREILARRVESAKTFYGRRFNPCVHRGECRATGMCGRPDCARPCAGCGLRCREGLCPRFEEERCPRLDAAPYVCNGCPDETRCRLRKAYYLHKVAHEGYRRTLVESRRGVNATEGELRALCEVLVPALARGQSPHHAMVSSPESFGVCERTVYNYINIGALPAARRHNLPMAVRYRKRRGSPAEHKVDRHCTEGRTWEDYQAFLAANPGVQVPQVDTVEGGRGDRRVLLTVMFPRQGFMVARLLPGKCARHVADAFGWMWRALGADTFRRLFPAMVKDNGTEFTNPLAVETSPDDGSARTKVFCARPYTATDKAHVERNHEYIRRVVLKGESFDGLTQEQVDLMMSHVNSYVRASLMSGDAPCRTPYERFAFEYGEDVARRLGIVPIPLREVTLRPELLGMD